MDTHTYGMGECLQHVLKIPAGQAQGAFIMTIVEKNLINGVRYQYVKASKASVYRLIKEYQKGTHFELNEEWNTIGRRPLLKEKQLVECTKKILADPTDKK